MPETSLIPKGQAQQASPGVEAQAATMKKSWQARNAKEREAAEEIAKVLVAKTVEISARAGAEGKLFGSVTSADVVEAIQAQAGVELDRKMVELDEPIRAVGIHAVTVKPHHRGAVSGERVGLRSLILGSRLRSALLPGLSLGPRRGVYNLWKTCVFRAL